MKNLAFILLVFLSFSGCTSNSSPKKVGFLATSFEVERFRKEADFFKNQMERFGYEVILEDCEENHALQYERAREMLEKELDILVVIPVNINTAHNIVDLANSEGVPVVAYNRMIMNADIDMLIYSDNEFIGNSMASSLLDSVKTGKIAVLAGDKMDPNAVEQKQAMDKTINEYQQKYDIEVVYDTYIEKWNANIAAFELQQVLQVYNLNGVIAGNDAMANAIIDLIHKRKPDNKVFVVGQDGDQVALKNISKGSQVATVYHPYDKLAGNAAEVIRVMLEEKSIQNRIDGRVFNGLKDVPVVRIKSEVITRENVEKYRKN
ncbi:substrate-binding domain-containing protein [Marinilabilia salmonicolor]|uniref:D-xylose transport system substrate-binding protein n=1 Tax=Marinilabilia salmonicolor TaxID=989 RepID=A0A368UUF1_9BACT|nr:substrate-binding domain-containing protein [Marinilabilia salmonicolor]RCW32459.1 D-xylose transport system substrate-binding protein [Marinilabilia salmonicolor]